MAWVCGACSTSNSSGDGRCVVCGAPRFADAGPEQFLPWQDHPVRLNPAALSGRGFRLIRPVFHRGEKQYWLQSSGYSCYLNLGELLCLDILQLFDPQEMEAC